MTNKKFIVIINPFTNIHIPNRPQRVIPDQSTSRHRITQTGASGIS